MTSVGCRRCCTFTTTSKRIAHGQGARLARTRAFTASSGSWLRSRNRENAHEYSEFDREKHYAGRRKAEAPADPRISRRGFVAGAGAVAASLPLLTKADETPDINDNQRPDRSSSRGRRASLLGAPSFRWLLGRSQPLYLSIDESKAERKRWIERTVGSLDA
jgi:hypothetical protein